MTGKIKKLMILSPVFKHNGTIPVKFTCEGTQVSPPLQVGSIPPGTKSLALIAEDPDAINGIYDHWIVWNIRPSSFIEEGSDPGISGTNSSGETGYHPPCPPSGAHRYIFNVYALSASLDLPAGSSKNELLKAMDSLVLARGRITGVYRKRESAPALSRAQLRR